MNNVIPNISAKSHYRVIQALFVGLLVFLLSACSPMLENAGQGENEERLPILGVAGLIPRNYPDSSSQDWRNLFEGLSETGNLVGIYTAWTDSASTVGQVPAIISTAYNIQTEFGVRPVLALGYYGEDATGNLIPLIDWQDEAQLNAAVDSARDLAERWQPAYLGLGVEVNRYFEQDPVGFDQYAELYSRVYAEVKKVSPHTSVFPIFQYELMRGGVFFNGDTILPPEWELMDRFAGQMDLAAFTTYPYLLYSDPGELPGDYYSEIIRHLSIPIAFTEMGWPSTPILVGQDFAFGGSEVEQSEYIRRFFDLTENLPLEFALWSFPHDLEGEVNPAFLSLSLRENNGEPKPAFEVWQEFIQ